MVRTIIISILSIGLIGVSYWGYQENKQKDVLYIHAENDYQRAFHELTYNMDLLHDKIGTSLAMNSDERISPHFVDIWKLSSVANSNVSQLPLGLLPFERTKEFLVSIGNFTYQTAVRNLDDDPLTDKETKTLNEYNKQAQEIKEELRKAQHMALNNDLRWMDVEMALMSNDPTKNSILDGFRTVEDNISEFADGVDGQEIMKPEIEKKGFTNLRGSNQSIEQINDFSKEILDIPSNAKMQITESTEASQVPNYNVTFNDGEKDIFMDVTKKGAHPITILVNRPINAQEFSLNDGFVEAEKYLSAFDYDQMTLLESKQFDNVGMFTFLYTEDDVRIFPDKVMVKVALDDGEVIGLNAHDYLKNHTKRKLPKPKLSVKEAKDYVNKNVKIEEEHLAVIKNDLKEEVLVYEFLGILNDETYRIFINAKNGIEEKVEKLTDTETNFEANI